MTRETNDTTVSDGTTHVTAAGPAPGNFGIDAAKEALLNTGSLMNAFVWDETPQGHDFWWDHYRAERLSDEARAILEAWIAEAEATQKEMGE